jgi:hypothetical protein
VSRSRLLYLTFLFLCVAPRSLAGGEIKPPIVAVETTLATDSDQIRQLAFDGDPRTYFASDKNPGRDDHFTLVFDQPVAVKSLSVTTGRGDGRDKAEAARLEVSADGTKFERLADFADGEARAKGADKRIRFVRIQPTGEWKHPLVVREIVVESEPAVQTFRYPVEFVVDVRDAPEMKEWADKAARICERQYAMINDELKSDGFTPRRLVRMTLRKDYRGVAAAGGGRITGSVRWFKERPGDFGAMVHETVHIVQDYRRGGNPGWLVEGIADYIRFFKYEPGKIGPINPARSHYDGSYRVSAAFLAYVTEKHDKQLVRKLNAAMRKGEYKDEIFKTLTGKTLKELDEEWRASLMGKAAK